VKARVAFPPPVFHWRKDLLKRKVAEPEAPPLLHPSVADLYSEKVTGRCHAFEGDERSVAGAREAIRGLMFLEPAGDQLPMCG